MSIRFQTVCYQGHTWRGAPPRQEVKSLFSPHVRAILLQIREQLDQFGQDYPGGQLVSFYFYQIYRDIPWMPTDYLIIAVENTRFSLAASRKLGLRTLQNSPGTRTLGHIRMQHI